MNTVDKKQLAQQTRAAWRRQRAERSVAIRSGEVRNGDGPALVAPHLRPEDIVDPADNTLNKDVIAAGAGLVVRVPAWANLPSTPGLDDTLYLEFARGTSPPEEEFEKVASEPIPAPADASQFPWDITLGREYLQPDGPITVRYRVIAWNTSQEYSHPITLIADATPPWGVAVPEKPGIPAEPITDAYLDTNTQGVTCTIPAYEGWQPTDEVVYWWVNEVPDDPVDVPSAGSGPVTQVPLDIVVPAQLVKETGDGGCYLAYMLFDKATNRSALSHVARVAVALGALPDELGPPEVPLAEDGQVDLMDVFVGVDVHIPTFLNSKPTDMIQVTWGTTPLEPEQIGSAPYFPIPIRVPTHVLKAEYGLADGPVSTVVSYVVFRGDVASAVMQTTVDVDLKVIGPDLPEWPDPVNPALTPGTVLGAVSNTPNELTSDDFEQDARIEITLYEPLNAGELINVYWNNVLVEEALYEVKADDATGDIIERPIPWKYILEAGNLPELPVHYRISAPGSPNEQHSTDTLVTAKAVVHTPPAPAFMDVIPTDEGDMLTCASLYGPEHAVRVQVPDLTRYLAAGDTVTLTWTPTSPMDNGTVLTDAVLTEPVVLDATTVTGFVWLVKPYKDHLLPVYDADISHSGHGRIKYSFDYQGDPVTSLEEVAIMAMHTPNGSCSLE